jgi:hypothetical protein
VARYLPTHSIRHFDAISIRLASPDKIKDWAKNPNPNSFTTGEVRKPETIDYRAFRAERDGLFCEAIPGPTKDWECSCGKYKHIRHRGVVCGRRGVEVTLSEVCGERMGYVQPATSVSHIWFLKSVPGHLGRLLDLSLKELERVLYYEAHLVLDSGDAPLVVSSRDLMWRAACTDREGRLHASILYIPGSCRVARCAWSARRWSRQDRRGRQLHRPDCCTSPRLLIARSPLIRTLGMLGTLRSSAGARYTHRSRRIPPIDAVRNRTRNGRNESRAHLWKRVGRRRRTRRRSPHQQRSMVAPCRTGATHAAWPA